MIYTNEVIVNNTVIDQRINSNKMDYSYLTVVPEGGIFVMGDNRTNSIDSREFGCVEEEDIVGKILFVIW